MHVIAAKAVSFREAQQPEFTSYQERVLENTQALAEALLGYDFDLVTGGSDTHLLLLDLRSKKITGVEAEQLLEKVGITANKNAIPFDPCSPRVTSGLRLGTPAITSRGMGPEQLRMIARLIEETLARRTDRAALERIRQQVLELCQAFPTVQFAGTLAGG
jgi:glycine hydroxymethyltransferase